MTKELLGEAKYMIEKLRLNYSRKKPAWAIQGEVADLIEEPIKAHPLYTVNNSSNEPVVLSCTGEKSKDE